MKDFDLDTTSSTSDLWACFTFGAGCTTFSPLVLDPGETGVIDVIDVTLGQPPILEPR
jgi:hypothetical protein